MVIRPNKAKTFLFFRKQKHKGPIVQITTQKTKKKEEVTVRAKGYITEKFNWTPVKDKEIILNLQSVQAKSWTRPRVRRQRARTRPFRLKPLPL